MKEIDALELLLERDWDSLDYIEQCIVSAWKEGYGHLAKHASLDYHIIRENTKDIYKMVVTKGGDEECG